MFEIVIPPALVTIRSLFLLIFFVQKSTNNFKLKINYPNFIPTSRIVSIDT
nr:MAG TPA: hypothetical protein [Caudoviricetes sp.]